MLDDIAEKVGGRVINRHATMAHHEPRRCAAPRRRRTRTASVACNSDRWYCGRVNFGKQQDRGTRLHEILTLPHSSSSSRDAVVTSASQMWHHPLVPCAIRRPHLGLSSAGLHLATPFCSSESWHLIPLSLIRSLGNPTHKTTIGSNTTKIRG